MTYTLVDTGNRGRCVAPDSTKGYPAMLDGYYIFPPGQPERGFAAEASTSIPGPPAGWDDLAALAGQIKSSGLTYRLAAVARVLLAEVIG